MCKINFRPSINFPYTSQYQSGSNIRCYNENTTSNDINKRTGNQCPINYIPFGNTTNTLCVLYNPNISSKICDSKYNFNSKYASCYDPNNTSVHLIIKDYAIQIIYLLMVYVIKQCIIYVILIY